MAPKFNLLSSASLLVVLCASSSFFVMVVQAAPWPLHARHATHRDRVVGRGLRLKAFHPKTTFKTFGAEGVESPVPEAFRGSSVAPPINDSALAFVQSQLGVNATQLGYRVGFTGSNGGKFAFVKQFHEGVPFINAGANVAWFKGKVVAFGSSFVNFSTIADPKPSLDVQSLIPKVEEALEGKFNDHPPTIEYLVKEDQSVALTHVMQIRNEEKGTWFEAYVCAHSGDILSVTDFTAQASYTVLPIQKQTFPEGQETLVDPQDLLASPLGWHSDGVENTTETFGNNVAAFINLNTTSQTGPNLTFSVKYDDSLDPTVESNKAAATISAFYIANTIHDVAYRYGFTEGAFNFQANNFGKGGKGNDSVLLSVQDASGLNNANFASPPDGQSGVCRMFIWDLTNPRRDGSLENDIIIHEMTHGITNRMTGGGTGRCLQTVEAGGMGEGWSDAMADWVSQKSKVVEDFVLGQYVTNNKTGIRTFPYSTDLKVNPLMYADIAKLNEVHLIGEVWATMLHNVLAALVKERGFSSKALTNPDTLEGNVVFMRLFMDALQLQPCNPTLVDARDAWLQADQNLFNGANKCTLSRAFADRGLGINAAGDFVNNQDVPAGC